MNDKVLKLKNGLVLNEYVENPPKRITHEFHNGFARVETYGKYNFIDYDGVMLFEQWLDYAEDFCGSFAKVYLDNKWNYINTKGEYISDQWFEWVYSFSKGCVNVRLDSKYNVLKLCSEPDYIFDEWYATIYELDNIGFLVLKDGKWNIGDFNGKILSDIWSDEQISVECGLYKFKVNGKYNYLNNEFKPISDEWYDWVSIDREYIRVTRRRRYNYLKLNGELLSKKWFDFMVYDPNHDYFYVVKKKKYNYIDKNGVLVFKDWSDDGIGIIDGIAILNVNGQWNLYKQEDSSKILDESFDEIKHLKGLYYSVKLNDKWNILKLGEGYISDEWFDDIYKVYEGDIFVVRGDKKYSFPRYLLGD